jgi:ribosome modulation factor
MAYVDTRIHFERFEDEARYLDGSRSYKLYGETYSPEYCCPFTIQEVRERCFWMAGWHDTRRYGI